MTQSVDVGPIPEADRTQTPLDLFLIFAGANIVATTLVTGASLAGRFGGRSAFTLIAIGSALGAAMVAVLAPVGPKLGVPSIIAARAALGHRGAACLATLLYASNFAWIALNNVIAASVCAAAWPEGPGTRTWAVALGMVATAVVAAGPRAVSWSDRIAVPLMLLVGILMSVACWQVGVSPTVSPPASWGEGFAGLDLVVAYQVSWLLMFADFSRFTRDGPKARRAVFLALGLTSVWYMSLGFVAARAAGHADPGAMMVSLGLAGSGAVLLALGTLTTNFVNIYMSALAWKSLFPRAKDLVSVWAIGLIGASLSLLDRAWIERYADFMLMLGAVLVPISGILFACFFIVRRDVVVADLYAAGGRYRGIDKAAIAAWLLGAVAYLGLSRWGGTLPSLAVSIVVFSLLAKRSGAEKRRGG